MKNLFDIKSLSIWIRANLQDKFAHIGAGTLLASLFHLVSKFATFLAPCFIVSSFLFVLGWAVTKELVDKKTTGFSYLDIIFTLIGWLIVVVNMNV